MKFGEVPTQSLLSLLFISTWRPSFCSFSVLFLEGPDSFFWYAISYFKCSLTQLSKSTDYTINTWYSCSFIPADPLPSSSLPLPESHLPPQCQHRVITLALGQLLALLWASVHRPLALMGQNHGGCKPRCCRPRCRISWSWVFSLVSTQPWAAFLLHCSPHYQLLFPAEHSLRTHHHSLVAHTSALLPISHWSCDFSL